MTFVRHDKTSQLRDGDDLTAAFVALHRADAGGADESEETTRWEVYSNFSGIETSLLRLVLNVTPHCGRDKSRRLSKTGGNQSAACSSDSDRAVDVFPFCSDL